MRIEDSLKLGDDIDTYINLIRDVNKAIVWSKK